LQVNIQWDVLTEILLKDRMMKVKSIVIAALLVVAGQAWSAEKLELKTEKEKLSYSIGASIGQNLKKDSTNIDVNLLIKGLKTSIAGEKTLMSEKEIRQVMNDYGTQLRQHAMASKQKAAIENKKSGDAFLAEYKSKAGVQALPSGVLYTVIRGSDGRKPNETDTVEVSYRGTLINGKEFDATEPGHPATLKVSALIAGWKQALGNMPVGSKWQLVIPPELAYAERGVGNDIGPNEVLLFDVELVAIK
jgi:FKBP-type peptidyl-prolyl cis-trans isomerase FklB